MKVGSRFFIDYIIDFNERSVCLWNDRNLEGFCEGYTEDATYITAVSGLVRGREAILKAYQEAYPDRSKMGMISVKLEEVRLPPDILPDGGLVSMAVGIVRWAIEIHGEKTVDGYSMVNFVLNETGAEVLIAQDTTP